MVPMNHNNSMSRNVRNHLITYTCKICEQIYLKE
jgi:hypothetical protein